MKIATAVLATFVLASMVPMPSASAHYASCGGGSSGSGSLQCSWSCSANFNVWVWATTNDGAYNNVYSFTDCGTAHPTCQAAGTCSAAQYTSTHQDGAACWGGSGNARGFSYQCYQPGASDTNWNILQCDSLDCTVEAAATLAARTLPVMPLGTPIAGFAVYVFPDHAIGYACSADVSSCVAVLPTCDRNALGETLCVVQ